MAMNKLLYHFGGEDGADVEGCERSFYVSQSVDKGSNASGVLQFSFPADPNCFTDTTQTYMSARFRVFRPDGTPLDDTDPVAFTGPGIVSLFKTCEVSINGTPLPPTNLYPYAGHLASILGTPYNDRNNVWQPLGNTQTSYVSSLLPEWNSEQPWINGKLGDSREVVVYGRVQSDFLLTCAQLLPPGMKVDVTLTRTPDSFALSANPKPDEPTPQYKIELDNVTVFMKRVELNQSTVDLCRQSLSEGGKLRYNRLGSIVQQIPSGAQVYRWNNIFNGGPLPHTFYAVVVRQRSFYGDIHTLPVYFEYEFLRSFRLLHNGRDVLPEPYTVRVVKQSGGMPSPDQCEASAAFMGLAQTLKLLGGPSSGASLTYFDFFTGSMILCAQINTCGGRTVQAGSLDLELHFNQPSTAPEDQLMCICFGELDAVLRFSPSLNIL